MKTKFLWSAAALLALGVTGCGGGGGGGGHGGGGGGSSSGGGLVCTPSVGNNPVPTIGGESVGQVTADASTGAKSLALGISGTNFLPNSTVLWNGTPLPAADVSCTNPETLAVTVPASLLNATSSVSITVSNPTPGGGTSSPAPFFVQLPASSPTLVGISSPMPASANALSGGFTLQVQATYVLANSAIEWIDSTAGIDIFLDTSLTNPAASESGTATLSAPVNNSLIAHAGDSIQIGVTNFNTDGTPGPSSATTAGFTINPAGQQVACLLAGQRSFGFLATGSDANGTVSLVGSLRVDNTGAVVNAGGPPTIRSIMDFKDPKQLVESSSPGFAGTIGGGAGSCVDSAVPNSGTLSFTVTGGATLGGTFVMKYGLRANGNGGRISVTNSTLSLNAGGQIQVQNYPDGFTGGSYAFGLAGENAAATRYAVAGALCNGATGVSFLQADFDDSGTGGAAVTASLTGGMTLGPNDAPTGRLKSSTAAFSTGATARPLTLTFYPLNGSKAFAMDSSANAQVLGGTISGTPGPVCYPLGQGGIFSDSSVADTVIGVHGEQPGTVSAALGQFYGAVPAGGGTCPPGGGLASLTADFNAGGTAHSITGAQACYSTSAVGRRAVTYTDAQSQNPGATLYLDGAGSGYLIANGPDIGFGFADAQGGNLSPTGGDYAFGPLNILSGTAPLNVTTVNMNTANATFTDLAAGGSSGAYLLAAGQTRGTAHALTTATTFGDKNIVFYVLTPKTIYTMDASAAAPVLGGLIK